ncbi:MULTISPECIES: hypothetical protein [unclassified Spirosoma]|uniref:hypothetical protein n=1 Tax=unclassified Spirosoma TaxID=2621999 RepID=UPI00096712C9|nr:MULTISPECIES: hypothetical protein [unclassified Spirosoma]MBN8822706.1 hypothetical protein [Spirosoma sp.]OJW79919.1 MAG: hypothetical protein BGO59_01510 [Spirosoma sp. 48-14]
MAALSIDFIIRHIASLQGDDGLFPAIRRNDQLGYHRSDTNVFFTAITIFTLQNLRQRVSLACQQLIDQMAGRAQMAYPLFRNKDGLNTYNFWPTQPSRHFPNGYLFRRFEHFRIPDDIDDTAMVFLTSEPSLADRLWLKDKLSQHANGSQRHQIRNTFPDYRHLRAYSTWFGKNMGVDFDACALSNMLYCIYRYNLPLNQHDTDSLYYLRSIVETGRYKAEPFQCAPHYARTSLIIYHIARLVAAFSIPGLASIHEQLIDDAYQELKQATNTVEQCMLATALQRLGEPRPSISLATIESDIKTFHFFIAGLLTAYQQPWLRRFANRSIVQMRWYCEAHSWALVGEYLRIELLND